MSPSQVPGAKCEVRSLLMGCQSAVRNVQSGATCLPARATIFGAVATWLSLGARPFPEKGEEVKNPKGKGREMGKDKEKEI